MKIEGVNSVLEALNSDTAIAKILIKKNDFQKNNIVILAKSKKIAVQFVDSVVLDHESVAKRHQGVIAFVDDYKYYELEDLLNGDTDKPNFLLVLDGVEDPHNFGSIIRTSECLGVDGIIIGKNRCCPVNETVIKTSVGAINHIKIARVTNINQAIEKLKQKNIWVYACELGGVEMEKIDFSGNIAIVLGSEGQGISALTKKLCDGIVTIKMKGKINSLNVSVAAGIVLNEVAKTRV